MDEELRWYEQTVEQIAVALDARMKEREQLEDRLHERPLLGEELDQLEAEVDAELVAKPLPDWRVEAPDDEPWLTWRQGDQPAFLAVVDWALDEGVLAFEDEVRLCRAAMPPPASASLPASPTGRSQ
ncbi:MAG TPA: hypothetical protein VGK67_22060 [Myxococcales bacterium]